MARFGPWWEVGEGRESYEGPRKAGTYGSGEGGLSDGADVEVLKGAAYTDIARELEVHAGEELQHAIAIAKQVDYLGGMLAVTAKPVITSTDPVTMLRADLENERETVGRYRERIRQAEAMGEYGLSATLRAIIVQEQEQEHEIDRAAALGIAVPAQSTPGE
jgi:bacterioferritin